MGIDPQMTAQGENIDQTSMTEVANAAQNGQTELRAEDSRACGNASTTLVTKSSRRSTRKPEATASAPGVDQSGLRSSTTGIKQKFGEGGGELVAHSSVGAFQGLSPAG